MRLLPYLAIFLSWTNALPGLDAQIIIRREEPLEFKVDEIGVDQGLSQGMVHGLVTDHEGYLWIGTKDGLNRYDGNHFHVFRNDPQDPHSIASNYILSLHVDDKGLLWVGTSASGLDLFNPSTASFIHFGKEINQFGKSTIKSIVKIFSDPDGRIVILDGNGERAEMLIPVAGKDPYSIDAWEIKPMRDIYPPDPAFPNLNIYSMMGFSNDGALLVSENQALFFIYPDTILSWRPSQTFALTKLPANKVNLNNFRSQYFMDLHHRPYCINPLDRLLYIGDTKAGTLTPQMQLPESFPFNYNRFFVDDQDRIWCKGFNYPLVRIVPDEGIYQELHMHAQVNNANPFVKYDIRTVDDHHNIWAGTSGRGLIRISARNDMFTCQPSDGNDNRDYWLVENGKSYNVDERFDIHEQKKLRDELLRGGFTPASTYVKDAHQQFWCLAVNASPVYHLVRIQAHSYSFSSWPVALNIKPVKDYNMEGTIMIDRHGIIWMGSEMSEGKALLVRITSPESAPEIYTFPIDVIHNEHPFISDWYVDDDNIFWIGTKQGLFVFNPATSQWKHFQVDARRHDALSNNHILSICPDPKLPEKYLWLGTDGGGLNRMDIKEETFNHYTTENGLPNNVIYGVQHDAHGQLWMSTNFGLCRFNPQTAAVWLFTVDDGLMGNEFNRLSYGKDIHGRLYFEGVEGLTKFDPEIFYSPAEASPIVINRLKLSNKEVLYTSAIDKKEKDRYILPAPIEQCQELSFPYTERMITIGFSLLDFTNPKGNKYRYKLEGFNGDWIEAGAVNEAVFTNLNPGKYTFLVSGSNSQNVWSAPARMQLTILSPWWGTWWFRSLLIMIIAATVYGFYRYRLQQTIKLQHLRNRIAADLHDEIGSTLSSISLAGAVIQHKLNNSNPEVEGFLHKINYNTQKMMEAMSDIVWAVNTKNDRFEQVLYRMRAFAVEILEPKEVMVHFDASPHISQLLLDMQQRKNLYLIFKEVIHNAAKYADCKNVWVTLGYNNGRLLMKVRDDGVGFDLKPEKSNGQNDFGGNGIHNMYHRAHELKGKMEMNSSAGQGTEVLLSFVV